MASERLGRGPVSDRTVPFQLIVLHAPALDLVPGILLVQEPMLVETLLPDSAIEGLEKHVVRVLFRPGEGQHDPLDIGPQVQLLNGLIGVPIIAHMTVCIEKDLNRF